MTAVEENSLERALRAAVTDPSSLADFYRELLQSEVYVIGSSTHAEGDCAQEEGDAIPQQVEVRVSIQNWLRSDGSPVTPLFTSLSVLQQSITRQMSYLLLPARTLLELTEGAALVLNPKSDYSKELLPHEVASLLAEGVGQ
ncbi:MAG: SseB family protein [Xanthomonadaceae bacterium]|nr:SseB family protein [Xanthomonadaceae bacterium]